MNAGKKSNYVMLETPEGVPLRLELGGLGDRLWAVILDLVILVTGGILSILLLLLLGGGSPSALIFLVLFLVRYGYFVFFEIHWRGSTPGKRVLQLRTVSRDGAGLSVESVLARNLMRDLELFLPMAVLLGPEHLVGPTPVWLWAPASAWTVALVLLPAMTSERTRAGDLIAGTIVVREPRPPLPRDEAAKAPSYRLSFTPAQLAVYGEHELETLADILHKASEGAAQDDDLRTIATTIAAKIGFEGQEPTEKPYDFLQAFYNQQRAELERRLIYGKRIASKHDRTQSVGSA